MQSAGVKSELEIDGFSVAVCAEVGVALGRHRTRSFADMEQWGDRIDAYDLIVALSPAAMRVAQEYTRWHAIEVEYWPVVDPTGLGETRDEKLAAYRQARDQIERRIRARFGPPDPGMRHPGEGNRLDDPGAFRRCRVGFRVFSSPP